MRGRRDELAAALARVTAALCRNGQPAAVLDDVLRELGEATHADGVYLFRLCDDDPGSPDLSLLARWCRAGCEPHAADAPAQFGSVARHGYPALLDGQTVVEAAGASAAAAEIRARVLEPMHVGGRLWGVLAFHRRTDVQPDNDDSELLAVAANVIALALGRSDVDAAGREPSALVKEVYHRVNNNLQGLIGLLRLHTRSQPGLREPMQAAIAQIGAMAIVYGIQGRNGPMGVRLDELVERIVEQARSDHVGDREFCMQASGVEVVRVAGREAVPVALIVNELVADAATHSNEHGIVRVTLSVADGAGRLRIDAAVGTANQDAGAGTASAGRLDLVKALLPVAGASLDVSLDDDQRCVCLTLTAPVVERLNA